MLCAAVRRMPRIALHVHTPEVSLQAHAALCQQEQQYKHHQHGAGSSHVLGEFARLGLVHFQRIRVQLGAHQVGGGHVGCDDGRRGGGAAVAAWARRVQLCEGFVVRRVQKVLRRDEKPYERVAEPLGALVAVTLGAHDEELQELQVQALLRPRRHRVHQRLAARCVVSGGVEHGLHEVGGNAAVALLDGARCQQALVPRKLPRILGLRRRAPLRQLSLALLFPFTRLLLLQLPLHLALALLRKCGALLAKVLLLLLEQLRAPLLRALRVQVGVPLVVVLYLLLPLELFQVLQVWVARVLAVARLQFRSAAPEEACRAAHVAAAALLVPEAAETLRLRLHRLATTRRIPKATGDPRLLLLGLVPEATVALLLLLLLLLLLWLVPEAAVPLLTLLLLRLGDIALLIPEATVALLLVVLLSATVLIVPEAAVALLLVLLLLSGAVALLIPEAAVALLLLLLLLGAIVLLIPEAAVALLLVCRLLGGMALLVPEAAIARLLLLLRLLITPEAAIARLLLLLRLPITPEAAVARLLLRLGHALVEEARRRGAIMAVTVVVGMLDQVGTLVEEAGVAGRVAALEALLLLVLLLLEHVVPVFALLLAIPEGATADGAAAALASFAVTVRLQAAVAAGPRLALLALLPLVVLPLELLALLAVGRWRHRRGRSLGRHSGQVDVVPVGVVADLHHTPPAPAGAGGGPAAGAPRQASTAAGDAAAEAAMAAAAQDDGLAAGSGGAARGEGHVDSWTRRSEWRCRQRPGDR
eukprot:scaffold195_cov359-Prasinococcus_capsulatus_cf.AAC.2